MNLKEKQRRILDVAIDLFKQKGFLGTSMRDIAAILEIKAASLYAHINSKDELLEWICFGIAEQFFKSFEEVKSADAGAREKLNLFIEKHLFVVLNNPQITNIYSNEWKHLGASRERFVTLQKQYQLKVEDFLKTTFSELRLPLESPKITVKFLLYTLNNSYHWYKIDNISITTMINEIRCRVLFGLIGNP